MAYFSSRFVKSSHKECYMNTVKTGFSCKYLMHASGHCENYRSHRMELLFWSSIARGHDESKQSPVFGANGLSCVQVGPEESLLVLVVHHVISDAWALQLLSSDLNAALEAAFKLHGSRADGPAVLDSGADADSPNPTSRTVAGRLAERLGQPPLQQMDYSAWLRNQLVRFQCSTICFILSQRSMYHAGLDQGSSAQEHPICERFS